MSDRRGGNATHLSEAVTESNSHPRRTVAVFASLSGSFTCAAAGSICRDRVTKCRPLGLNHATGADALTRTDFIRRCQPRLGSVSDDITTDSSRI